MMSEPIIVPEETKATLDERGGEWGIYQNLALDSSSAGHMQFLRYGEGCTYVQPPPCMPDGAWGAGWKYVLIGRYRDGRAQNIAEIALELSLLADLTEVLDAVRYPTPKTYPDPFPRKEA